MMMMMMTKITCILPLPSPLLPPVCRFTLVIIVLLKTKMMTNKEYDDDIVDNYDDVDMLCREARVLTAGEHVMEKIKMTSS